MGKIIKIFSITIIALSVLCVYSYIVVISTNGGSVLGLGPIIKEYATFPNTVKTVIKSKELRDVPASLIPISKNEPMGTNVMINELDYDLFGIMSFYNEEDDLWMVILENYRNGQTILEWQLPNDYYHRNTGRNYDASRPKHTLLLPDSSIVVNFSNSKNLLRLDKNSTPQWVNREYLYHHSMNLGPDGNIWICATDYIENQNDPLLNRSFRNVEGNIQSYRDDQIIKIDIATGKIIYQKSISDIFLENDQFGKLFGHAEHWDPIHLNDIEPVLVDGPHWKEGDVFLSLRNTSSIIHYRPSNGKIINTIEGSLLHQHDVVLTTDHEISIFNNRHAALKETSSEAVEPFLEMKSSELTLYDYSTDSMYAHQKNIMNDKNLYTPTAGLHFILDNGDVFLDLDDFGRIVVLRQNDLIFSKIYPSNLEGYKHLTSWPRIYEKLPFKINPSKKIGS